METIELYVNGEKQAEVQCKTEDKQTVTTLFSQLGIRASFHNYNFQYSVK